MASLYPDYVFTWNGAKPSADKAVDGITNIGNSGGNGAQNCAVIRRGRKRQHFLRIALGHSQLIKYIRLHLRDGRGRYDDQNGLIVSIGDSPDVDAGRQKCGSTYNARQDQSPNFQCNSAGQYVWMVLTSHHPLQICEAEVYAGKPSCFYTF